MRHTTERWDRNARTWLPISMLCLALAGCQPSNLYIRPDSGPTARLRVVLLSGPGIVVFEGTRPNCVANEGRFIADMNHIMIIDRGASRRVGIPLIEGLPSKVTTELIIPANRPFTAEVSTVFRGIYFGDFSWCRRAVTFTPEDGKDYEIAYQASSSSECSARVSVIEPMVLPSQDCRRLPTPFLGNHVMRRNATAHAIDGSRGLCILARQQAALNAHLTSSCCGRAARLSRLVNRREAVRRRARR
jgi:hypothetical protein